MEFFQTQMGSKFYQSTMPKIATELHELNKNLEKANELKAKELELKERELLIKENKLSTISLSD